MSKPLRKCRVCGLEAWNEAELELFTKDGSCTHGRQQICKKCKSKEVMRKRALKPKPPKPKKQKPYLRKCKDCGLEAKTEADLELFRLDKKKPYGRDTWCKECFNKWQRPRHYQRVRRGKRKKELIASFPKPMLCYFCGKPITVLKGKSAESIAIHSLDGNHENYDPENKVPAHRGCHSRHHAPKTGPKIRYAEILKMSKKEGTDLFS